MNIPATGKKRSNPVALFPAIILILVSAVLFIFPPAQGREALLINVYYLIPITLGLVGLGWVLTFGFHQPFPKKRQKGKIAHPEVFQEYVAGFEYNLTRDRFIFTKDHPFSNLGITQDELSFSEFLQLLDKKERNRLNSTFIKILRDRIPFHIELKIRSKEERMFIYSIKGRLFLDETGKTECVSGIIQDITIFRETEKKLLEHKKRLERTQQLAQISFFDYNWNDQQFNMSSEMHNILELENNYRQLNHAILDKIFPDDIVRLRGHAFLPADGKTLRKGEVEFRAIAPNGRIKYIYAQYEHQYNEVGHRTKTSGWLQDVTSHRINEMALAESEEKYRNMFALESDALFLCDNDTGEILETNAAATNMFGYTSAEFNQITAYDIMVNKELIKDRLKHHHELLNNITLTRKSGEKLLTMVSLAYFIWKGRNVHLAAIRDVSKIKKAEEELELTKFTLDHAALMVFVLRKDGSFHYINEALYKTLGYSKEELLELKIFDIEEGLTEKSFLKRWEIIKKERTFQVQKNHLTKQGKIIPCDVVTNYLQAAGEEYKVAFIQDIRKRKELEEQVRQSEKMNAVGQLAGGIAHDFNNQLMGISGYAHLLRERLRDTQLLGYVENIIRASEHSTDLTGKLLAFSRKGKYISVANNAHDLIKECVILLKPGLGKQIEIELDQKAENPIFEGDTSSIQNAILNLAINARDAMTKGGIIHIATQNVFIDNKSNPVNELPDGAYLSIKISDNGTGIQQEHMDKIFEPFFSTKSKGHGTGLGLSATFGTITAHHGTISVNSEPGKGSTFTIYLPSSIANSDEIITQEEITLYGEGVIMLVDDEEIVRQVTGIMIRNLGYNVVEFDNGPDGIAYYRKYGEKVAAVILDLMMPGMSGYEVFTQLKALNNEVKVLLFSGFSANDEVQRAMKQGAAGYLQKPARKESLSQQLAKIAGKTKYFEKEDAITIDHELPIIKALDIKKALQQVEGDAEILKLVFLNYLKKYHTVVENMEGMAKNNDQSGLYLTIHSLKSVLGTMGANALQSLAEELENTLDTDSPVSLNKNPHFEKFKIDLSTLKSNLNNWKEETYSNDNQDLIKKEDKTTVELLQAINSIRKLIQQFSPANIKEITEICQRIAWPVKVQEDVDNMITLLDDFDFEEAGQCCQKIENSIK